MREIFKGNIHRKCTHKTTILLKRMVDQRHSERDSIGLVIDIEIRIRPTATGKKLKKNKKKTKTMTGLGFGKSKNKTKKKVKRWVMGCVFASPFFVCVCKFFYFFFTESGFAGNLPLRESTMIFYR